MADSDQNACLVLHRSSSGQQHGLELAVSANEVDSRGSDHTSHVDLWNQG